MIQQSQQAREREQQLNQQMTEQVCIVHEFVIVLLMVVTAIEPATDQREGATDQREEATDQREGATDQREETTDHSEGATDQREGAADQ